jgi:hypothetical protein
MENVRNVLKYFVGKSEGMRQYYNINIDVEEIDEKGWIGFI